jgi:hypothetical protein
VLLLGGVHQTTPLMDAQPQLWRGYLALIFDSMRAQAAQPLPHHLPHHLEFTGLGSIPDDSGKAG